MEGNDAGPEAGTIQVFASSNTGLPIEHYAKRATANIIRVGENAHPLIVEQAKAFQTQIEEVILRYMKMAIENDRVTLIGELMRQGHEDMAQIIRRL